MSDPSEPDRWPPYFSGGREDIFALGVISLIYGHLEAVFATVFSLVTDTPKDAASIIFQRLNNEARLAVVERCLKQTDWPDGLKGDVRHFLDGFGICAQNRHRLMHASMGGFDPKRRATVFSKVSKSGLKIICPATEAELRAVADASYDYMVFGENVWMSVTRFKDFAAEGLDTSAWRKPLPNRPPLPIEMDWKPPPERRGASRPPRS